MILKGYLIALLYGAAVLALGLLLWKSGMPKKYSRKTVHILVGFEWFILYHFMGTSIHFLFVCLFFTALLLFAYRKRLLPMIASDGDNAPGTVYYGISMSALSLLALFLPDMMLPFGAAVLVTSVGDGFGGIVGQAVIRRNPRIYRNKTLLGTLTMFSLSFLSLFLFSIVADLSLGVFACLAAALFAAGIELVSGKGVDNITVPILTALYIYAILNSSAFSDAMFAIGLIPLICALVLGRKKLTGRGTAAAVLLDLLVASAFGDRGFVILLLFFGISMIADRVKPSIKEAEEKNGRSELQVISNALVGGICALTYLILGDPIFIVGFVTSFAEALGDTVASGFGALSAHTFDLFHFRPCKKGESGGMSVIGTSAAVLSAALLGAVGGFLFSYPPAVFAIILLSSVLGVLFDSLLGSLVQMRFSCPLCGKRTEGRVHCGTRTNRVCGVPPFDNNAVNLASNLFSALAAVLLCFILL